MIHWPFVATRLRPRSARLRCAAFAAGTRPQLALRRELTRRAGPEGCCRRTRSDGRRRARALRPAAPDGLHTAELDSAIDCIYGRACDDSARGAPAGPRRHILDAYGNRDAAWRPLCAEFARLLGTVTADELRAAIIESATWVWSDPERARRARLDLRAARRMVVRGAFTHLGIGNTPVADTMADRFSAVREAAVKPFPGAIDTLRRLRAANVRLALLTNGQRGASERRSRGSGSSPSSITSRLKRNSGSGSRTNERFGTLSRRWECKLTTPGWLGTTWTGTSRGLSG